MVSKYCHHLQYVEQGYHWTNYLVVQSMFSLINGGGSPLFGAMLLCDGYSLSLVVRYSFVSW